MDPIRVIVDSVNAVVNIADTTRRVTNPVNNETLDSTSIEYICMAAVAIVLIVCFTICLIHLVRGTKSVKSILKEILKINDKDVSDELIKLITTTIKEQVIEDALKKEENKN